jgi:hypothetical protein
VTATEGEHALRRETLRPDGTRKLRGEVLNTRARAKDAAVREARRAAMYAALAAHPESAAELLARAKAAKASATALDPIAGKVRRALRKVEADALRAKRRSVKGAVEDPGTPFTILKLTPSPVARLLDKGRIGPEALEAAQEIERVFTAISGALLIHPQRFEKRDRAYGGRDPAWLIDATARYRRFADHWSRQAGRGHPLLAIVIAAVQDLRPCWLIDRELKLRHGKAEATLIAGLQDYAARAGWVRGRLAREWQAAAAGLFRVR